MIDIARLAEQTQPLLNKYSKKALDLYEEMESAPGRFSGQFVITQ